MYKNNEPSPFDFPGSTSKEGMSWEGADMSVPDTTDGESETNTNGGGFKEKLANFGTKNAGTI
jgi:hypothetical protein